MRLGWTEIFSGTALAGAAMLALATLVDRDVGMAESTLVSLEPARTEQEALPAPAWQPVSGSALSRAAFGLSALQPETYNGEIVLDIIDASPLAGGEKDRLSAKLLAAEAGHAQLPQVLEDIRLALAVE